MGKRQRESGRIQTELGDGYMFTVSFRGKNTDTSPEKVTQSTYTGAKENCYQDSKFTEITKTIVAGRTAETYSVINCLGYYTEYFLSDEKNVFELAELYVGQPNDQVEYRKTTHQILSTFKFLE